MKTTIKELRAIAIDRIRRAQDIDVIHIVDIGDHYILVTELYKIQLANEYTTFIVIETIRREDIYDFR